MEHIIRVKVNDETLEALQARADHQRRSLELSMEGLLRDAARVLPLTGRAVVLAGDTLEAVEKILGGGSLLNGADALKKVERLAGISFFHVRLPFTPGQMEALKEKADRQGLSVEELINRTAPRVYEQFFDLIQRV